MPPPAPAILNLTDPSLLTPLAADAQADGRRMVGRLIDEWSQGVNRFDRPGERAYVAVQGARVVAVCGLNIDPYAGDPSVARVRRLYVSASHRRHGVASALLRALESDARRHFRTLRLRTHDPAASAFYQAAGFTPVTNDPTCTHRRDLTAVCPCSPSGGTAGASGAIE